MNSEIADLKVQKRDGRTVDFQLHKIKNAVEKAFIACNENENVSGKAMKVTLQVLREIPNKDIISIEEIQDNVENALMDLQYHKVAKEYILYRLEHQKIREEKGTFSTKPQEKDEHLKEIAKLSAERFDNDPMREFVYMRTYSRWIPEKGRREFWQETVERFINFVRSKIGDKISEEDYHLIFDYVFQQKVMPSMRLLQFAGPAAERCNVCAYNCSFSAPTSFKDLADIMYLSMSGTGVGFSVEKENIDKFPKITLNSTNLTVEFEVADSKEGWCDSLIFALENYFAGNDVVFDYSFLRPKGARLLTSGGRSSGPEPLKDLHRFIKEMVTQKRREKINKLTPLNVHDIICKIGQIVIAGGVRRCIAKGSKVLTEHGSYKNIEDIKVGDKVLSDKSEWCEVKNVFEQGFQKVLRIRHEEGWIDVTPNHRIATFPTKDCEPVWKYAKDLTTDDTLGFPVMDKLGKWEKAHFPTFLYVRPPHSTTCKDIVIPELDVKMAWFIGNFQGDGCVHLTSGSGTSSVAVYGEDHEMKDLVVEQFKRFEVNVSVNQPTKKDNCYKICVNSKQLATFLHKHVKQSKTSMKVPDFIKNASPKIKGAFVQGLMDADGSVKTRPINVVTTIYKDYAFEIQSLLLSITIMTRIKIMKVKNENWQDKYQVNLINPYDKKNFQYITSIIGFKRFKISTAQYNNGWKVEQVLVNDFVKPKGWTKKVCSTSLKNNIPINTLRNFDIETKIIPIKIKSIDIIEEEVETYDIEVEKSHNFVCNGVLVHNSALISISDLNDYEMRDCKTGSFWNKDSQRFLANNSAAYNVKPSQIDFMSEWIALAKSGSGERGIFNRSGFRNVLPERRVEFLGDDIEKLGGNPCMEILLKPFQFCNLTEVICRKEDTKDTLIQKVRVATILGTIQSSLSDFKYIDQKWKKNQDDERLLGVSLTGIFDCPILSEVKNGFNYGDSLLVQLKKQAIMTNESYAQKLGINRSHAITAVKPSGTVSQMVNSSSGIHPRFSEYYIRRIRIASHDPLLQLMKAEGYEAVPEVGQIEPNVNTYVLSFPVKAPEGTVTAEHISTIKQLEHWKRYKVFYTEHNPSVTIYVKPDEWLETGKWVWDNWDCITGLSFLPYSDHVYQLAPYEKISKEEYEMMIKNKKLIDFSRLIEFEKSDTTDVKKELACVGGVCEL